MTMLDVHNLSLSYGQHRALEDVSIRVDPGEIVVILGANGAGKSTLLRVISGICEGQHTGSIEMEQHSILGLNSDEIVERGIALVPEGRGIFDDLNVRENLILGAYSKRARENEQANLDRVFGLFPKLRERQSQIARTMSGGEQQMVAIGRAMMSSPAILMLDEPSLGLSPLLCKELFQNLSEICKTGIGILLVEQNAKQSLAIANRGYLLENAHIVHGDSAKNLTNDPAVQKAYLGVGSSKTASMVDQKNSTTEPFDMPVIPKVIARSAPRQSTTDLIGTSIDALVASASAASRKPAAEAHSSIASIPSRSLPDSHEHRLRATISEIERTAVDARLKQKINSAPKSRTSPIQRQPGETELTEPPVVIEVYRAPRVEVWRRQSGTTKFRKEQGAKPNKGGRNAR